MHENGLSKSRVVDESRHDFGSGDATGNFSVAFLTLPLPHGNSSEITCSLMPSGIRTYIARATAVQVHLPGVTHGELASGI